MKPPRAMLMTGLLWTSPWWLGFFLFLAAPLVMSLAISFCDYPLLQPPVYVGAANYSGLLSDPVFHKALGNTLLYAILAIPLSTAVAVLLACLLNRAVAGQAVFRACIFLPTVVPLVAVGMVWMWMLNPEFGLINQLLRALGHEGVLWLDTPRGAMASMVLVSLWLVGSPVVIYLAGLQDIPESLYEAARLDGASSVGQFRHITLPGISPAILFNMIVGIIAALQVFALPLVMWRMRPGPDRAVYFYTTYLYDNAFRYLKMGYASAMAWIQLLMILGLSSLIFWLGRKRVYYGGA